MNKYELIEIIGNGTFGQVYEGRNRETNERVAVKKLKEKYNSLEECLAKTEVKVLEKLNHENIVQLKEIIREKSGDVSYIFEYCDCNLYEFIENHHINQKIIPEPIIRDIVMQITKGIKFLHSNLYFHRDLKPENILVILNNYDFNDPNNANNNGQLRIKIADFGTAKEISLKNNSPQTEYVCTRWYRAPECVLRSDNYDEKIDIWAIGCIMAELYKLAPIFAGENEFDQIQQILKIMGTPTKGKWPWGYEQADILGFQLPVYYKKDLKKIIPLISKEGVNLLNEIFQFDPAKRPSCSKILNHPYFKTIDKIPINDIPNNLRNSTRKSINLSNRGDSPKAKNLKTSNTNNYLSNRLTNRTKNIFAFNKKPNDNNNDIDKKDTKNRNNILSNLSDNTKINNTSEKDKISVNCINISNNKNNNENDDKNKYDEKIVIKKKNLTHNSSNNNITNNLKIVDSNNNNNNAEQNNINKSNKNVNSRNYIHTNINNIPTEISDINVKNHLKILDNQNISNKDNNIKNIIKINETKAGIVTKKLIRFTKNKKEEKKNNDNKDIKDNKEKKENGHGKKQLKVRIIEVNDFNKESYLSHNNKNNNNQQNSRKSSFFSGKKEEQSFLRNKSNENNNNNNDNERLINFSSQKEKPTKIFIENKRMNNIKKFNYKMVENAYDNKKNNILKRQTYYYLNHNKTNGLRKNKIIINSTNTSTNKNEKNKIISLDKNMENNKIISFDKNMENNKIISLDKNIEKNKDDKDDNLNKKLELSNSRIKNKNKKHHRFYESNGSKYNVLNYVKNNNYHSYNGYMSKTDEANSNKRHHNIHYINNCSIERNYSTKRNVIFSHDNKNCERNSYNIKRLGDYYLNNNEEGSPKNQNHTRNDNNYKNGILSPIKTSDQNDSLFSSFVISKNNDKFLFGKSQSLLKNNNQNPPKIISQSNFRKINNNNNCNNKIKVVNINLSEIDSTNNTNTNLNNSNNNMNNSIRNSYYSQRSNSKQRNSLTNLN